MSDEPSIHKCVITNNSKRLRKKAFCISGKTIVIIDEELVKHLGIDDETWFEEEEMDNGVLLRISRFPNRNIEKNVTIE